MPRNGITSYEEKLKLVQACIQKELGVCEAARIARVDHSAIRGWVMQYEAEGAEGILPHTKNRTYTPELKQEAVLAYLSGKGSLLEICKKYGIRTTILLVLFYPPS